MGRTKIRVRAQRKFAQGVVPIQSNPSSSAPPPAILHASNKPVSGPSPAPIVLNQCSPRDLVTFMSLRKLHSHGSRVPIVVLEKNNTVSNKTLLKKKLKDKRNLRTNVNKRRYMLRNGRKIASDLLDARRVSVSDSGEDTPLSSLRGPPVANLPPDENATSAAVVVKAPLLLASSVDIDELGKNVDETTSSERVVDINNTVVVDAISAHLPSPIPVTSSENNSSERDSSMPNLMAGGRLQEPTASSQLMNPNVIVVIPQETADSESHNTPSVSVYKESSLERGAGASQVAREQLAQAVPSERSLRLRRTTKPYQDNQYLYGAFTDISSVSDIPSHSSTPDPDFRLSQYSSASSSISFATKRFKTLKRKHLNKERARNKIRKMRKKPVASQALTDEDLLSSSSETNSEFRGFNIDNTNTTTLRAHIGMGETNVRNAVDMIVTNLMTATWIRNQSELSTSTANSPVPGCSSTPDPGCNRSLVPESSSLVPESSSLVPESNSLVPESSSPVRGCSSSLEPECISSLDPGCSSSSDPVCSSSNAPGYLGFAIPGSDSLIAPENRSLTPATSEQPTRDDNKYFKMPKLPARFAKRTKNCPTRSICDLQELLKCQPTDKEPFCGICKRCSLIAKYIEVSSKLPASNADEPDILELPPRDIYEFDTDESGLKYLKRGRDLVRNVLTTNRFPIWLSNLEMNLQTTMFQKEHKLGTLKRTLQLKPNDVADEMVSKILTRVNYLARCIAEDKKELDSEARLRLRSSKFGRSSSGLGSPRKNKPLTKVKKQLKGGRAHCKPRQSTPAPTNSTLRKASVYPPAEGASAEPRHLVVRVTPLEDDAELRDDRVTPPVPVARRLYTRKTQNSVQNSASVRQPLPAEGDITPLTSIELADYPPLNQQEIETDSYSSFDQPSIEQTIQNNTMTTTSSPPPVEMLDVLVYRPTPKEFQDPIAYIKKIEPEALKYGICKIVPPEPLNIPCHLDESCMFKTVKQYLGRLFQRWGSNCSELTAIQTHVAMLAQPRERDQFTKVPLFDGLELDLVKLYRLVLNHGGIEELFAHSEKWARIAEQMSLVSPRGKPDLKKLEKLYCKHVLPYESLSHYERSKICEKVDKIWKLRLRAAVRRAKSPLHYQRRLLADAASDDEVEDYMDAETRAVSVAAKPCFERVEECIAKGRSLNLATFRRIAAQVQAMRFGNKPAPTTVEIEANYWKILSLAQEHVCVLSACIDTSVNNLGHTSDPAAPGGSHPWNLKRICDNQLNILRWLGKTLSVTVPTLSLNQLFSTNCWHRDPHKLAWMDFMHEGTTKIWYGVPASGSRVFQNAVETLIPSAVQSKGTWLASDTTMLPPGTLMERGVPVHRVLQEPGEFIVVFPGAYACSIATGLTISESIYFEGENWLNNIDEIFQELREDCEPAMFSNTLLLMRMAREPTLSGGILWRVYISMNKLLKDEFDSRREAVKMKCRVLLDQSERADGEQAPISWPNQEECSVCRVPLILSKMNRSDEPRSLMCLKHGLRLLAVTKAPGSPEPPSVTLLYSNEELRDLISQLEVRFMDKGSVWTKGMRNL